MLSTWIWMSHELWFTRAAMLFWYPGRMHDYHQRALWLQRGLLPWRQVSVFTGGWNIVNCLLILYDNVLYTQVNLNTFVSFNGIIVMVQQLDSLTILHNIVKTWNQDKVMLLELLVQYVFQSFITQIERR